MLTHNFTAAIVWGLSIEILAVLSGWAHLFNRHSNTPSSCSCLFFFFLDSLPFVCSRYCCYACSSAAPSPASLCRFAGFIISSSAIGLSGHQPPQPPPPVSVDHVSPFPSTVQKLSQRSNPNARPRRVQSHLQWLVISLSLRRCKTAGLYEKDRPKHYDNKMFNINYGPLNSSNFLLKLLFYTFLISYI